MGLELLPGEDAEVAARANDGTDAPVGGDQRSQTAKGDKGSDPASESQVTRLDLVPANEEQR